MLRLAGIKQRIDDLFGDAVQLASSGASIYGRIPPQLPLVSRITRELFASALNPHIYGTGPFFERGAFGTPDALASVYVRRSDARLPATVNDHPYPGGVEVDYYSLAPSNVDDYLRQQWFQVALRARGHTVIWGPYTDQGRSFISVLRAFERDGRIAGVMSVDVVTPDFINLMRAGLVRGDLAAIVGAQPGAKPKLETGSAVSGERRLVLRAPIRFAPHSMIELSSDAAGLLATNRAIWLEAAASIAALVLLAGFIGVGLLQRWRSQDREDRLELEQRRLEDEIALSRAIEREMRKAAYTDALTGLPNRLAFLERAHAVLGARSSASHAVFFIDLDRFNIVNETLGHLAGDELLKTIGARLRAVITQEDLIARLGGDEFVILAQTEVRRPPEELAAALLAHLGEPIVVHGRSLYPEASIGVVTIDGSYASASDVLRDADIAMYEAKHRGRSQYVVFDAEMRRRVASESELENALRRALERGELVPFYQPVVSTATGAIAGFEALVRWQRGGEIVSAREFMPFAESHGLVAAIDVHVLHEVYAHSHAIYNLFPGAKIAVNISASELGAPGLVETIERLRERCGHASERIELEITETTMMTSSEAAQRTIERLRDAGIAFVLDDFGTGYSSLAYLQRLPIAGIKIDRTFVAPLPADAKATEILRSIVLMARSFGLATTAEGVETVEQYELLREIGVDYAQGFFFSPAVDISALVRLQARSISAHPAVE